MPDRPSPENTRERRGCKLRRQIDPTVEPVRFVVRSRRECRAGAGKRSAEPGGNEEAKTAWDAHVSSLATALSDDVRSGADVIRHAREPRVGTFSSKPRRVLAQYSRPMDAARYAVALVRFHACMASKRQCRWSYSVGKENHGVRVVKSKSFTLSALAPEGIDHASLRRHDRQRWSDVLERSSLRIHAQPGFDCSRKQHQHRA